MYNKFFKIALTLFLTLSLNSYALDSNNIEALKVKANENDANAQYKLALIYLKGESVKQDLKYSLELFDKACANKYKKACEMARELNENNI